MNDAKVVQYTHLNYEAYRNLEKQCREFKETTHTSTGGFYHKSIRLQITPDLIIEYHGPLVGGYGHHVDVPGSTSDDDDLLKYRMNKT